MKRFGLSLCAMLLLLSAASGCASSRIPRVGGEAPPALSDGKAEAAYQAVLDRSTVSKAVYDNLDTQVFFYVTWQSNEFVAARVEREGAFRAQPAAERGRNLEQERARLLGGVEFHLAVSAVDYRVDDFDRPNSIWRVALVVDGQESVPASIERLGRTTPQLRSIYGYMEPFWVGYRVRFPSATLRAGQRFLVRVASALGQAEFPFAVDE